ncbi:MAG: S1 RNA-binding domain-containing protein [Sandaracinaceae bacterium]
MSKSDSESFAELFAKSEMPSGRARRYSVGDEVEGVVAHVSADAIFVDLDAKQQGYFERMEIGDVEVGQTITGRVMAIDATGVKLAKGFGRDAGRAELQLAYEQGVPVEGKITAVNKGGAEVEVAGARGFCPFSQLDKRYVEDPSTFVGRTFSFLVSEIKDRDVVLSRRKLLEREEREAREAILGKLQVGATMRGRVTQVRDFGAFVDLGGVEGLVPMRDLSHDRVQRAEDVVKVGDVVEAKITKLEADGDKLRISLSIKALATDPWDGIDAVVPTGKVLAGQVTRITDFGAFVRLAPGVEGLLHVSEIGARLSHASEGVEVGQQLLVVARSIDRGKRRISLALAPVGATLGEAGGAGGPVLGAVVRVTIEKHENFGLFAQIEGTRGRAGRGLIPMAELGLTRGADVRKELPVGTVVTAKVVDATEGRVRLSIRAASEDAERAVFDSYRQEQSKKGSMGTLGDLLRDKLKK